MKNDKILFGKFEVSEVLKKDSQSGVYLANHIFLNKKIVLKTLNTNQLKDQTVLYRFKREAKILAQLDHPNIIKVLDFGIENEIFYLSFEYFEGESLREFIKRNLPDQNQFNHIITQILSGLHYAHQQKIIHRDLKPENILINRNLEIKIADFGLALSENETQVTSQESIVGTPGYMSPEQIRGEALDQRTDIFSFGIIAYELLTGNNPFIGKDIAATINNILFTETGKLIENITSVPIEISALISKCLEKNKNNRFQTTEEILNLLGIEQTKNSITKPSTKSTKVYGKVALAIFIIIVVALLTLLNFNRNQSTSEINQTSISEKDNQKISNEISLPNINPENLNTDKKSAPSSEPIALQKENKINLNIGKEYGELMVTCYPWADIYINNQRYETTPLNQPISMIEGVHRIKLIHPNFPSIEKTIEIKNNERKNLDINFYKYFGFVQFQIIPWGEIKINNQKVGITPLEKPVILNPGKYNLTISNPNFGIYLDTILVQSGETLYYKLNLNFVTNWHNN